MFSPWNIITLIETEMNKLNENYKIQTTNNSFANKTNKVVVNASSIANNYYKIYFTFDI